MSKVTGMGKKNDDIDIEGAEEGLLSGSASNAGSAAAGCCASLLDEKKLAKTTDTLAFVPMLCIIMVFARLRANDMGLDPQMWGQMAMWCATIAILVQTIIVLAFPSLESGDGSDDDEGAPLSANAQNRVEEDDSANVRAWCLRAWESGWVEWRVFDACRGRAGAHAAVAAELGC